MIIRYTFCLINYVDYIKKYIKIFNKFLKHSKIIRFSRGILTRLLLELLKASLLNRFKNNGETQIYKKHLIFLLSLFIFFLL